MKFSTLTTLLASAVLTSYVNAAEYYAEYEVNWENMAGKGLSLEFQGCGSALVFDAEQGGGEQDGDLDMQRSRWVTLKATDSSGNTALVIATLEEYVESQLKAFEESFEATCKYNIGFDVMGSYNSEEWMYYCGDYGYMMENAFNYDNWHQLNCDDDCQEEIEQMNYENNNQNQDNENQDQNDENNEGRRLRSVTRLLNNQWSHTPGQYSSRQEFCMYAAYDCDEENGAMGNLQNFQELAQECKGTGHYSPTTMDADGNYVEYMVQLYCNPNTHEMALGVFVDEECAYPMNVDIESILYEFEEDEYGNEVAVSIDADVGFMDFKATMNCDQTNDDNNGDDQIPSYLYDADKENNNNNRQRKLDDENNYYQEAEAELSECCREVLENSIGCFGGLFGYYSLEMEQQCETVQQVLDCTSSNSEGCGFSNIDLNGENYLAEEGSGVMKYWVRNDNKNSGAMGGSKTLIMITAPLTALFAVTACYYHGKLSSAGKNAALAGQGGAMA